MAFAKVHSGVPELAEVHVYCERTVGELPS
jgi:hypothetical protein